MPQQKVVRPKLLQNNNEHDPKLFGACRIIVSQKFRSYEYYRIYNEKKNIRLLSHSDG